MYHSIYSKFDPGLILRTTLSVKVEYKMRIALVDILFIRKIIYQVNTTTEYKGGKILTPNTNVLFAINIFILFTSLSVSWKGFKCYCMGQNNTYIVLAEYKATYS